MKSILTRPKFSDIELTEKAQKLHDLIWGGFVITLIIEIGNCFVLPQNFVRWIFIIVILLGINIILSIFNHKGHYRQASVLYVGLVLLLLFSLSWTGGGVRSLSVMVVPMIVFMSGLLFGYRYGILVAVISAIIVLFFVFAEIKEFIPASNIQHHPLSIWVTFLFLLTIASYLQYQTVHSLDNSLNIARNELVLRIKTEELLKRSEKLRNLIFDSSLIPIVVMDATSKQFIDCNPAAVAIYQYNTKDEVIGKNPLDVSYPFQYDGTPSNEKAEAYIKQALVSGSVVFEWKHQRPNRQCWDAEVHLMKFEMNNKPFIQFTLTDITERKNALLALYETESRLKSISDNFVSGMFYQVMVFPDGTRKFTYLSQSVEKLYGIKPEDGLLDPQLIYGKINEEDLPKLIREEEIAIANNSVFKAETRMRNPDGSIRWSSFISSPFLSTDGNLIYNGIEMVITERKQAEMALKKSEEKFSVAFRSSPIALTITRISDNIITDVNKAFEQLSGYTRDEIIGHTSIELNTWVRPEDRDLAVKILKTEGKLRDIEFNFRSKLGNISLCQISAEVVQMGDEMFMLTNIIDLSERIQQENALRESEERFKVLSSMATEGLMIQKDGIILDTNIAFAKMAGFADPKDLIGKNGIEVINFTPDSKLVVADHLRNNSTELYDLTIINSENKIITVETKATSIIYKGQNARMVNMRDITDRKKAEEDLKVQLSLQELVLDISKTFINLSVENLDSGVNNALKIIAEFVKAGRAYICNYDQFSQLGFITHEWFGNEIKSMKEVYPVMPLPSAGEWFIKHTNNEIIQIPDTDNLPNNAYMEKLIQQQVKSIITIPLIDGKNYLGFLGFDTFKNCYVYSDAEIYMLRLFANLLVNIQKRKQADDLQRIVAIQLKANLDNTPNVAVQWYDIDGHILYWNKASEVLYGWAAEETIGKTLDLLILTPAEANDFKKILDGIRETGQPYGPYETPIFHKNGTPGWILATTFGFPLSEGKIGFACMDVDISELKKNQEELKKYREYLEGMVEERTSDLALANQKLTLTNEFLSQQKEELQLTLDSLHETQKRLVQSEKMASLGVLSAGVAHEINNPLNFISGGALGIETYVQDTIHEHSANVKPFLNIINEGIRRASNIVTSLNHYSRSDDLPFSECDIHEIVNHCLNMLKGQFGFDITIEKKFDLTPHKILGSEGKLHQAILNILANAGQAIENKGTIAIHSIVAPPFLTLQISDTGSGISTEHISRIFDPFFTTKEPGKGTGLGLSITYNIIKEHKGTLNYESSPGKGTKAIIKLPLV